MLKELKGEELKPVLKFLEKLEGKRDKKDDTKAWEFFDDLTLEVEGANGPCFGNEIIRVEGTYKDALVELNYFPSGNGFGPWVGLILALGKVYHADVPNRAHYATKKLIGCSISVAHNPEGLEGSGIPNKTKMKKGELAARFEGYYQVTTSKDLLKYAYRYLMKSKNEYGSRFINKLLKADGEGWIKLIEGW